MTQEGNHIIADKGKVFRRIESGEIYGEEIYLGYSYYINGIKLEAPHLDVPEDFEEIDIPEEYFSEYFIEEPEEIEEDVNEDLV